VLDIALHHAGPAFSEESLCFFDRQQPGAPPNANRSQYFTDHSYADGLVFAIWKPEVRQFLIDNAGYFLTEYHVDGFCHDRVNVLIRDTPSDGWRFYQELTNTLRYLKPEALEQATSEQPDPWVARPTAVGGAGFDVCLHGDLCHTDPRRSGGSRPPRRPSRAHGRHRRRALAPRLRSGLARRPSHRAAQPSSTAAANTPDPRHRRPQ